MKENTYLVMFVYSSFLFMVIVVCFIASAIRDDLDKIAKAIRELNND